MSLLEFVEISDFLRMNFKLEFFKSRDVGVPVPRLGASSLIANTTSDAGSSGVVFNFASQPHHASCAI